MLTLLALSLVLLQEPQAAPSPPDARTRVFIRSVGDGPGLDKDGDGQVTREEFSAPMADAFAELDKDGSGRLSTDELAAGPGGRGEHVFVMSGPDARGGSAGERRIEFRRPGGGPGGDGEVIVLGGPGRDGPIAFTGRGDGPGEHRIEIRRMGGEGSGEMDKDGDGKVSEAEFVQPLRDAFTRMDANRSGFIEDGEKGDGEGVRVFTHRIETRGGDED